MKLNLYFLSVIWTMVMGCTSKTEAKFIIINKSGNKIDSLIIYPNDSIFSELKAEDSVTYYSNMTNIPKVDGSYLLSYKTDSKVKKYNFGYYTNGYPLEKFSRIHIFPDTIIVKGEYGKKY